MRPVQLSLEAVIVAVTDDRPRILTLSDGGVPRLPAGSAGDDRTLELGMRRLIDEQTGLDVGYVEQLYTFGDIDRQRVSIAPGARAVGVAYLVLTREALTTAEWIDWYHLFPWEDHRAGRPAVLDGIEKALEEWAGSDAVRRERVQISFGVHDTPWDGVRALDRYELLYEARLVPECVADARVDVVGWDIEGEAMALDHRRVAAAALSRLRGKLTYRPVVFELLPETFTLSHLQRTVEALAGQRLHAQNFRRLVERGGLVEGTGRLATTGGRPAELFRFRREVLTERPKLGIGQ